MEKQDYRPLDFETRDIYYILREHDPPRNVHAEKRSNAEIKAAVLQSPRMKKVIRDVADEYGCEMKVVEKESEELLEEIGHKLGLPAVRLTAGLLRGMIRKVFSGIYVNQTGLDRLSTICRERPVVLVPSHRSYLDFILVSYVMLEHNLPLPCIAAGLDFMSMTGVSTLLRHCGAFFLRRTFGSDQLYKAAFSEYVKMLLCSQQYPMEFFVEGTRSRSAKSLHPKLGLLSMVLEPYLEGRVSDIMMVPISISYERTLEELLFTREQLGVPKPKESTSGLVKAFSLLSESYGSIYVTIGDGISVHDFSSECGISRVAHSLIPKETSVLLPDEWMMVKKLGHAIVDHLHRGMVVFPPAIVAAVLLNSTRTPLSTGDLESWVKWLNKELLLRGATLSPLQSAVADLVSSGLEKLEAGIRMLGLDLNLISSEELIQLPLARSAVTTSSSASSGSSNSVSDNTDTVRPAGLSDLYKVKLEKTLLDDILKVSHAHLSLGHYRNQILHIFLLDSLMALTLEPEIDYKEAKERHEVLVSALSSEFVLPLQSSAELFEEGVDRFVKRGLVSFSSDRSSLCLMYCQDDDKSLDFLRGLLLPFVLCVFVVCHQLLSLKGGVQSLSVTVKHVQLLAAAAVNYGFVGSYEVLSLTVIKNGLASLHQAGLILQASNEYGTGHDRLVKVMDEPRLQHITSVLGDVCKVEAPMMAHL